MNLEVHPQPASETGIEEKVRSPRRQGKGTFRKLSLSYRDSCGVIKTACTLDDILFLHNKPDLVNMIKQIE